MLVTVLELILLSWQKTSVELHDVKIFFFSGLHTFLIFWSCLKSSNTITRRLSWKDVQFKTSLSNTGRLYPQQERQKDRGKRKAESGRRGGERKWGGKIKRRKKATIKINCSVKELSKSTAHGWWIWLPKA